MSNQPKATPSEAAAAVVACATKADLLGQADLPEEMVSLHGIPPVRVRGMQASVFSKIQDACLTTRNGRTRMDNAKFRLLMVMHCVVGSDGRRLFGDDEQAAVKGMPAGAFNDLAAAAQRVNGLVDRDEDPSEAQEETDAGFSSD